MADLFLPETFTLASGIQLKEWEEPTWTYWAYSLELADTFSVAMSFNVVNQGLESLGYAEILLLTPCCGAFSVPKASTKAHLCSRCYAQIAVFADLPANSAGYASFDLTDSWPPMSAVQFWYYHSPYSNPTSLLEAWAMQTAAPLDAVMAAVQAEAELAEAFELLYTAAVETFPKLGRRDP